jgi:Protein of unknown function (DUF2911)
MHRTATVLGLTLALAPISFAAAQPLPGPPSGDNQRASVSQWIGPVEIDVVYHSPDVHAPDGSDRRGKIWGDGNLVPYGMSSQAFGTCGQDCPWRAGANENTVFRVSHDVLVEGQKLPAGAYGLHMIPGPDKWTVIFSKDSGSWGSFFYDPAEDALRVEVTPKKNDYHEWLTYEFTDRETDHARLELQWEDLAVPIEIRVEQIDELYFARISDYLRDSTGFDSKAWTDAARFCVQHKIHLDAAERWARHAIDGVFVGEDTFDTHSALAQVLLAENKPAEAKAEMDKALADPGAGVVDLHQYGRQLIGMGDGKGALAVFQLNAQRHPGVWPVEGGLMRGYAAVGDTKHALEHARKALAQAPDTPNRQNLERMIAKLEKGDTAIN